MEGPRKKPDGFNAQAVFGIVAAIFVIALTAAAAGGRVFGKYDYGSASADKAADGILSLIPSGKGAAVSPSAAGPATPGADTRSATPPPASPDLVAKAKDAVAGTAGTLQKKAENAVLARLVSTVTGGSTKTAAVTDAGAVQADTGSSTAAADTSSGAQTDAQTPHLLSAIANVWNAFIGRAFPFLKGIGGSVWSVFRDGSYYSPPSGR